MRLGLGLGVNSITSQKIGAGFTGILDEYSGAAAAYSVRRLSSTYTDGLIRVRRSSDDTEQDIGFDANGDLDTTALLAFVNEDVNQYTSDFSSTEDLVETNGTGSAAQSIGGVDDAYKFTTITGTGQMFAGVSPFSGKGGGNSFRVQADVYLPSTNAEIDKVRIFTGYGTEIFADVTDTDTWVSIDQTLTITSGAVLRFQAYDGTDSTPTTTGANVFYLKNIVVTQTTADGAVTTWYDQSGNGNNATNATASEQPLVVSGGTLVTENSKAAIDFDGVDDYLGRVFSLDVTLGYTNFYVCSVNNDATKYILASVKNSSNRYAIGVNSSGDFQSTKRTAGIVGDAATYVSGQVLLSDNSTPEIYLDGNLGAASVATLNNAFSSEFMSIGKNSAPSSSGQINGVFQEIILFNSDQSTNRTGIETNINNHFSIYTP